MAKLKSDFDRWVAWAKRQHGSLHLHSTLFRVCCLLVEEGLDDEEIFYVLRVAANTIRDRHVPDREIQSALTYARSGNSHAPRWPHLNLPLRGEIERTACLGDLVQASPTFPLCPRGALEALFPDDPLLCIGPRVDHFQTGHLSLWRNLERGQFVVPNPMSAEAGETMEGKVSARTNANTGPRHYQVVEFDFGQFDTHAAILIHLRQYAPLVMAVYSGGKSLHGWFDVRGWPEAAHIEFFAHAVELGADPKMWTPSQFSRMPLGLNRATGRLQQIYYFNPQ